MKTLTQIREQIAAGAFEFSRHAFRRAVERNISEQEIREAGRAAELVEDYPNDKYSPSALLRGGHGQWTRPALPSISGRDAADKNHHPL